MALDPLATIDDLTARMRLTLSTDADLARAATLLSDASDEVRAFTGQIVTLDDTPDRIKVTNRTLRLPQRPVIDVTAVQDMNEQDVLYSWPGGDLIIVSANVPDTFAWEPWPDGITYVDVYYTHGLEEVPGWIVAIVCQMAARAFGRPPEDTGMTSESVAGYSYTVGAAAAAGAVGMLPDEAKKLARLRRPAGMSTFA